jgi:hypothetical protein
MWASVGGCGSGGRRRCVGDVVWAARTWWITGRWLGGEESALGYRAPRLRGLYEFGSAFICVAMPVVKGGHTAAWLATRSLNHAAVSMGPHVANFDRNCGI